MNKFKTPEDFVFSTLRALDVAPQKPEEVDPQLRSLRSAAVHTGVARRLGGYVQELGWLGCLDASGAVGVAGRRSATTGASIL